MTGLDVVMSVAGGVLALVLSGHRPQWTWPRIRFRRGRAAIQVQLDSLADKLHREMSERHTLQRKLIKRIRDLERDDTGQWVAPPGADVDITRFDGDRRHPYYLPRSRG